MLVIPSENKAGLFSGSNQSRFNMIPNSSNHTKLTNKEDEPPKSPARSSSASCSCSPSLTSCTVHKKKVASLPQKVEYPTLLEESASSLVSALTLDQELRDCYSKKNNLKRFSDPSNNNSSPLHFPGKDSMLPKPQRALSTDDFDFELSTRSLDMGNSNSPVDSTPPHTSSTTTTTPSSVTSGTGVEDEPSNGRRRQSGRHSLTPVFEIDQITEEGDDETGCYHNGMAMPLVIETIPDSQKRGSMYSSITMSFDDLNLSSLGSSFYHHPSGDCRFHNNLNISGHDNIPPLEDRMVIPPTQPSHLALARFQSDSTQSTSVDIVNAKIACGVLSPSLKMPLRQRSSGTATSSVKNVVDEQECSPTSDTTRLSCTTTHSTETCCSSVLMDPPVMPQRRSSNLGLGPNGSARWKGRRGSTASTRMSVPQRKASTAMTQEEHQSLLNEHFDSMIDLCLSNDEEE